MPQLTPEQQDAVDEAEDRQLFRLHKMLRGMFGLGMTADEMRRAKQQVHQGVTQAMQQMEQRKSYTPLGGEPTQPRIDPRQLQDGGFINEGG